MAAASRNGTAQVAGDARGEVTFAQPTNHLRDDPRNSLVALRAPAARTGPHRPRRLDRSDAKVTLAKIRKSRCLVHATWDL